MSSCSSCEAEITWALTKNDKRIPLDAAPVADGNLIIDHERATERGMTPVVHYLRKGEETTKDRYVSHFATCPNAEKFRR